MRNANGSLNYPFDARKYSDRSGRGEDGGHDRRSVACRDSHSAVRRQSAAGRRAGALRAHFAADGQRSSRQAFSLAFPCRRNTGPPSLLSLAQCSSSFTLESLSIVAPAAPATGPVRNGVAQELRFARVCYDHLAGKLGVLVTQTLCGLGYIDNDEAGFLLTGKGQNWFHAFGIDVVELRNGRRPLTRRCFDWSERRAHLAGALGAALVRRFLDLHWIGRAPAGRAVRLTNKGRAGFRARLSLDLSTAILP